MSLKSRRVTTYLPKDVDERLKEFMKKDPRKSESAALLFLLDIGLSAGTEIPLAARIEVLEQSVIAIELKIAEVQANGIS